MATDVVLPQWGMNMQEGTLIRWLKEEGDAVAAGEPLAEVETAKIEDVVAAPVAGVLKYIVVPQGETVPVTTLLPVIADPGEEVARPAAAAPSTPAASAPSAPAPSTPSPSPAAGTAGVQAVPAARGLARQHDVDLSRVQGTGPGGRITEDDVARALEAPAPAAAGAVPLSGMRRTIAERMLRSVQTMARVTLTTETDVTAAVELRKQLVGEWRAHRLRPVARTWW